MDPDEREHNPAHFMPFEGLPGICERTCDSPYGCGLTACGITLEDASRVFSDKAGRARVLGFAIPDHPGKR
jgi:hypothetical protein